MIDPPQIVQTEPRLRARLHLTVPKAEIRRVMGPGLHELRATVAAQGVAVAGPWFVHHLRLDPAVFDLEICLPVATPVTAAGRMQPGVWPAMRVARTVYRGPYEGLPAAWGEFEAWMKSQDLKQAADLWEVYAVGPESSPDPAAWRTELNRPLVE